MLKNKNNEYDDLRGKHARLESDHRRISELENTLQEQNVLVHLLIEPNRQIYRRYGANAPELK